MKQVDVSENKNFYISIKTCSDEILEIMVNYINGRRGFIIFRLIF